MTLLLGAVDQTSIVDVDSSIWAANLRCRFLFGRELQRYHEIDGNEMLLFDTLPPYIEGRARIRCCDAIGIR